MIKEARIVIALSAIVFIAACSSSPSNENEKGKCFGIPSKNAPTMMYQEECLAQGGAFRPASNIEPE